MSEDGVNMKNVVYFTSPILLVLFFCCSKKVDNNFIGSYQSVSESEWTLTLSLYEKGRAEIFMETWESGQYEKRTKVQNEANWTNLIDKIVLYYGDKSDTLIYNPKLSFSDIGKSGDAPGFLQSKPDYDGRFNNVSLWKLP